MAATNSFKVGSYGWIIKTKASQPFTINGSAIDLSSGWVVEAHLHNPSGVAKIVTSGVVGDAAGGVTYTVADGDFDGAGPWRVVFWVDDGAAQRFHSCDYGLFIADA